MEVGCRVPTVLGNRSNSRYKKIDSSFIEIFPNLCCPKFLKKKKKKVFEVTASLFRLKSPPGSPSSNKLKNLVPDKGTELWFFWGSFSSLRCPRTQKKVFKDTEFFSFLSSPSGSPSSNKLKYPVPDKGTELVFGGSFSNLKCSRTLKKKVFKDIEFFSFLSSPPGSPSFPQYSKSSFQNFQEIVFPQLSMSCSSLQAHRLSKVAWNTFITRVFTTANGSYVIC